MRSSISAATLKDRSGSLVAQKSNWWIRNTASSTLDTRSTKLMAERIASSVRVNACKRMGNVCARARASERVSGMAHAPHALRPVSIRGAYRIS